MHWNTVLETHLTPKQLGILSDARIGLVGAGGLGSNCALMLARSGIRHFVVADPDVVSPSNLNRQQFFPCDVGRLKVEALGETLRLLNPEISLHLVPVAVEPATCDLFDGCTVVVEAVDDPAVKKSLVEALLFRGHRVVSASGMAGWGGPVMTARSFGRRLIVVGDHCTEIAPDCPPMAPRVIMAAALEADAVLTLLLGACSRG